MKKITLPEQLSSELAEEVGIHIGDGSLLIRPHTGHYEYYVCLSIEEREYMKHVCELMYSLYSLKPTILERPKDSSLIGLFSSKALAIWKLSLGLPSGEKGQIGIPKTILESKYTLDCLRGIFDTDGSLTFKKKYKDTHYYPVIKITLKSRVLITQILGIISGFGFKYYGYFDGKHRSSKGTITTEHSMFVSGKKSLKLWMDLIGSKSPIHTSKYLIWKRFGFCPPRTVLADRRSILEDKIDPLVFEDAGDEI